MAGTRIPNGLAKSDGFVKPEVPIKPNKPTGSNRPAKPDGLFKPAVPNNKPGAASSPKTSILNPAVQNPFPDKVVLSHGEQFVPARVFFREAAASMGFPKDSLSVALFAFMRFFSITPGQSLVATLRREILTLLKTSSPENPKEKAALEAKVLALVSALDKGVTLLPETLERYSHYFVFPSFESETPSERGDEKSRDELPDPEEIKAIAGEEAQKDELLDFLNTFRGKNGQNWMVFPFNITVRGTELRVFIRIIKSGHSSASGGTAPAEDGQLIADIAGPKRQWRCLVKRIDGRFRADIQVYPGYSKTALKSLQKKAERFLGKSVLPWNFGDFEEIRVKNGDEAPSWVEDLCSEFLPSINKSI